MNLKNWIPLIAAVMLAVIALIVAKKAFTKSGTGDATGTVMAVMVAGRDIPPGREITAEDVSTARLPADMMPGQAFSKAQDLIGRTTITPLVKGQAVVETLLAPNGTHGGLTSLIPNGYRAMTFEVNQFTGVAGMIQPGCKVDVIAILREEKTSQPLASTILQNIEVRAVGRNVNPAPPVEGAPPPPPSDNVTVLVTPKQAQILQLASQNGRPWLVLRNGIERKEVEHEITTLAELRNDMGRGEPTTNPSVAVTNVSDPFAATNPRIATARVVQIIRGGVESTMSFSDTPPAPQPATRPSFPRAPTGDGRLMTDTDQRPAQ